MSSHSKYCCFQILLVPCQINESDYLKRKTNKLKSFRFQIIRHSRYKKLH
ncbi:unnamed protein product [Brugia timori]|uniref:Uncharacterized protein n=1 Tax=Brugia timori TaxID=42155 RepID=A0A0R3QGG4_9BILA|nr:unnamed protein product [Brugia timori]